MDASGEGLQTVDIAGCGGAVVFLALAAVGASSLQTGFREEGVDVVVFDLGVDVDGVGVEDGGVVEGLQDGRFEGVGEEGVFVGGLEAADEGVEGFARVEQPVEEGEGGVGEGQRGWDVDGGVEGELDPFD